MNCGSSAASRTSSVGTKPGGDRVDRDPVGAPFGRELLDEQVHARLAGAVGGEAAAPAGDAARRGELDRSGRRCPASIIFWPAACESQNAPLRLMSMTCCQSSSANSSAFASMSTPARFTSMSRPPSSAAAPSTAAVALSPVGQVHPRTDRPVPVGLEARSASSRALSSERPAIAIVGPGMDEQLGRDPADPAVAAHDQGAGAVEPEERAESRVSGAAPGDPRPGLNRRADRSFVVVAAADEELHEALHEELARALGRGHVPGLRDVLVQLVLELRIAFCWPMCRARSAAARRPWSRRSARPSRPA